jgi:tryptophan synthase alpha chain
MSRIGKVFKNGRKALVAYVTAGYPDMATTVRAAGALAGGGADIIELGIPFSDPLADGATIQKASHQALLNGTTPESCLKAAAEIRKNTETPLVFMTYYNPIYHYGLKAFCRDCVKAGIDGLIVPDLPPDEGGELEAVTREQKLDLIYLLAPSSTDERIEMVAKHSRGFIYLVSLTGVTGARKTLSPELPAFTARVRAKAKQPLCVGFGIGSAEQAVKAAELADGVIIGSKIIELIEQDSSLKSLKTFIVEIRKALDNMNNTGRNVM